MRVKAMIVFLMLGAGLMLSASNLEADFVQCVGEGFCDGTALGDIINGTADANDIRADEGDDSVFAGDNPAENDCFSSLDKALDGPFVFGVNRCVPIGHADQLNGAGGNDFLSGGLGQDFLAGEAGNDTLLPGPDVANFGQIADGGAGNDNTIVLVGEITSCLLIYGQTGFDVANLIGFGPYSAAQPFGIAAGFTTGWIHVVDPIGGGDIFIQVFENGDLGTEIINGLLSPNVTFVNTPDLSGCNVPFV